MARGGRGSGGGRRSYSAPRASRAPPPAPRQAAAPAPAAGGGILSTIADGWLWGTGMSMANRAMDAVFGPRKFEIEHTAAGAAAAPAMGGGGAPPPPPSNSPCDVHAQAFQDCINDNGSDISRCQFYVNVLNDCRRNGQVAVVQA
ncbi:unnamed protein product [Urochloa decumbens]|uniref:CHCH domain-containing protein n=1 Tax=Urochloa decumbens TaxID=240449 RepID=A0ABC8W9G6_9POAL